MIRYEFNPETNEQVIDVELKSAFGNSQGMD